MATHRRLLQQWRLDSPKPSALSQYRAYLQRYECVCHVDPGMWPASALMWGISNKFTETNRPGWMLKRKNGLLHTRRSQQPKSQCLKGARIYTYSQVAAHRKGGTCPDNYQIEYSLETDANLTLKRLLFAQMSESLGYQPRLEASKLLYRLEHRLYERLVNQGLLMLIELTTAYKLLNVWIGNGPKKDWKSFMTRNSSRAFCKLCCCYDLCFCLMCFLAVLALIPSLLLSTAHFDYCHCGVTLSLCEHNKIRQQSLH